MRKMITILLSFIGLVFAHSASALLSMELTRGIASAIPIAVSPFSGSAPQDLSAIVRNDLQNSGRFKVYNKTGSGVDNIVVGAIQNLGNDQYRVSFELREDFQAGKHSAKSVALLKRDITVPAQKLRALAHHISDLVYEQLTGNKGVFSTRLAYVVVQRAPNAPTKYVLEVSDQDGYGPRPLLTSTDPVMSPSWSPNGKQIAYVSFENHHASIYIEDVVSGMRHLVSEFPGINGAPAWSPDGRKLAVVLSKSGSPNVYILDLATRQLTQLTRDFYINTEPSWAPDGRSLVFTSTRSGGPQIYQINLKTHATNRLTFDGNYNARASFTADGNHVAMIHGDGGAYNIGILDLDTGTFRELTHSSTDNGSPSLAPNGSMILYDEIYGGQSVLAMVATDGSVQIRLPARVGEAQDPSWSPFLS